MNKLYLAALALLVCATSPLLAQKKGKEKEPKFGEVEEWEWNLTSYKGDTSVGAIYIFDIGNHEYNSQFTDPEKDVFRFFRHYRIKVLNAAAADDVSNIAINYNSNSQYIGKLRVHTLERSASGAVIKHELDSKTITDEKSVRARGVSVARIKRFSLPKVKPGTIVEVSYVITSRAYVPPRWFFQSEYPTLKSILSYTRPTAIYINETLYGNVESLSKLTNPAGVTVLSTPSGPRNYDLEKIVYRMDSVPAFAEFRFMYAQTNYLSGVDVNLTEVRLGVVGEEELAKSWFKISRDLQKDKNYFNEEDNNEPLVKEAAAKLKDPDTLKTIRNVYDFLKKEIKVLRSTDVINTDDFPSTVREVLRTKSGFEFLKIALGLRLFGVLGYDPAVLMIRSRSEGALQRNNPEIRQFDRYALVVSTSKTDYLMDLSEDEVPFGMLPKECFNGEAWLVSAKEERFIQLPMLFSDDQGIVVNAKLSPEGGLVGEFNARYTGYGATDARAVWRRSGSKAWLNKGIFAPERGLSVTEAQTDTTIGLEDPVTASGKLSVKEFANEVDGELYFNPIVIPRFKENPLKQQTREWPVEFDSRFNENYLINLELPQGFVPAELPKNVRIALPDRSFEFTRLVSVSEGRLTVSVKFINRREVYPSELYPALRDFMSKVVAAMQEEIILKPSN